MKINKVGLKIYHLLEMPIFRMHQRYYIRFKHNAYIDGCCKNREQYEASIIRLYHTIEKGLTYENYRAGFGQSKVGLLIQTLEDYSERYGYDDFIYETALAVLYAYIEKNKCFGIENEVLNEQIKKLPGKPNQYGGVYSFEPLDVEEIQAMGFKDLIQNRHSVRHFSEGVVPRDEIISALNIAQNTPSACNRQGWKVLILENKEILRKVLQNQNGNAGFGEEINKLLVVLGDTRYFQKQRELYQVYIDGGMFAANLLNALHYEGIATIPLSASLSLRQEKRVRRILQLHDAEEMILFVGIGKYLEKCVTTMSKRHRPYFSIIE